MPEKTDLSGNFKVKHLMFGDFPEGHVFSADEFKRLHALPPSVDKDTYHDGLLQRGLDLGAIERTPERAMPTPGGAFRPATPPKPEETGKEGNGPNEGVKPTAGAAAAPAKK